MPCYRPLEGWMKVGGGFTASASDGYRDRLMKVPCGRCIGCRLDHSRVWATRMVHETQMHDEALFLSLTYDDDRIPENGTLVSRDMTLFLKRLRKHVEVPIRFYQCGEYGGQTARPHYHAIIWGWWPSDAAVHSGSRAAGDLLYESRSLEAIWGHGYCPFGCVTFESCAYVSRYVTKKVFGEKSEAHYRRVNGETGEIYQLLPEFSTMSQGIGRSWIEKHWEYTYAHDHVIVRGHKCSVPRYYDLWLADNHPEAWLDVRRRRALENFDPLRKPSFDDGGFLETVDDAATEFFYAPSQKQQRAGEVIAAKRLQARGKI